ncbi:sensor histidine kinase [Albibacterium bauzanense]|uniref:histidine kinase n=1 Tax=Albibacterium bauzanense TaxID=653929 RepID=A0A4V2PYC0_9SPHI|nr:HAMP domain-containing sensor histidine kinase [Albibacterium bauzanense]TCK85411.1 two-component system phosphate regulon sensor histidine kinase PhoR [Albibacterium bauzanense]
MSSTIKLYKVIALLSLAILIFVQSRLVYNTVILNNKQYYLNEKAAISESYNQIIHNDKLFPGGQSIIDGYINPKLPELEFLYYNNRKEFTKKAQLISDSLFQKLRQSSNMDRVIRHIVIENQLKEDLHYALVIEKLKITFDGTEFIDLFDRKPSNELSSVISGDLIDLNPQNLITSLKVSSAEPNTYSLVFLLHVDTKNRIQAILKSSLSTFILSFISIVLVIGIYFLTYKNWLKQKALSEIRSDFINNITHEFNTPIATILVANKSLQRKNIDDDNKTLLTNVIERQSLRLKTFVSQVVDTVKFNKKQIKKTNLELIGFINEITQEYELKKDRNVVFSNNFDNYEGVIIKADRFLLITLLNNIIDNAIKHNLSSSKLIHFGIKKNNNEIRLYITDNGVGIPKNLRKKVFEKFYQADIRKSNGGLGLGLFYVNEIIKMHEWQLEIQSKEGHYTTFCIIIKKTTL